MSNEQQVTDNLSNTTDFSSEEAAFSSASDEDLSVCSFCSGFVSFFARPSYIILSGGAGTIEQQIKDPKNL